MAQINRQKPAVRNKTKSKNPGTKASLIDDNDRDGVLSHEDAVAGCPTDFAVAGEEDAGIGIEFLMRQSEDLEKEENHDGTRPS